MTRRARNPLGVLVAVATVPALGLGALWGVARGAVQLPVADAPDVELIARVPIGDGATAPTELLSLRRSAPILVRELNLDTLRGELSELGAALNDRSCVAVSVEGLEVWSGGDAVAAIPGSVQKILVASVAPEILGDDFRFTTSVLGDINADGVISGNLYLRGGGDPLLASDWYPQSGVLRFPVLEHTSLDVLADRIVEAGVRTVSGDIVGDGSRYDDEVFAPGWGPGVGGVDGGPIGALTANDGLVLGDSLRQSDPAVAAARELRRLLADRGVNIAGGATTGLAPAPGTVDEIASIRSAPLSSFITEILLNSHNNTAEALVKEFGVALTGDGSRQAGLDAMAAQLERTGRDLTGSELTDGSGLSRENLLRCGLVLSVLQSERANQVFTTSLPVLGQSGTLAPLLTENVAAGRLAAKTGTLNNPPIEQDPPAAKGLAGYVPDGAGGTIEFVLLLNGPSISATAEYLPIWDEFAEILGSYPRGPGMVELGPR